MAKSTPEGKVKKKLLDRLKSYGEKCFYYMPVQNGMGNSGIPDIMVTIQGVSFGFECKATRQKQPTTLQATQLEKLHKAGGVALVVDDENIDLVLGVLDGIVGDNGETPYSLEDRDYLEQEEPSLYRWRKKLEPMEFD